MKFVTMTFLLMASTLVNANPSPTVVYGIDNRSEPYEKSEFYPYTRGVMAQISDDQLTNSTDTQYTLNPKTHGEVYKLCPGEKFADQPQVGWCSAFLVAPDVVVTAGHCVEEQTHCDKFKWVFGYEVTESNGNPKTLDKQDVYSCKKIIHTSQGASDYAVIQLDRPTNGTPLELLPAGESAKKGDPLVMIGYPARLPMKVSDGAKVVKLDSSGDLVTNLDAFGGNSGSVVLNSTTGQVVGILVSGQQDYRVNIINGQKCNVVNVLPESAGGETVTSISSVPRDF